MAVTLLVQRDYPSWGYMVEHGATTMWERWNSDRGDVGMNSYNHYAFGAIGSFLYRRIAGIAAAEPGFARARIAPIFDRRLGNAGADYRSAHGLIRTDWRYEGDRIKCDVALPANVSAEFVIPETIGTVDLDGKRLAMQGGAGGPRSIEIGPGPHAFVCTLARGGDA